MTARHRKRKTPNFNYKPPRRHSWRWLVFLPIIIAAIIAAVGIGTRIGHLHKPAVTHATLNIPHSALSPAAPVAVKKPAQASRPAQASQHTVHKNVTTYTVKTGDTLWGIAVSHLGSGLNWHKLYALNHQIGGNPALLHPGEVLTL